ncbi:OmpA family protein [Flagellimonas sp.]|uniref:OmpA family protein n=1 Tax=Flagellimonas sp. TaxID=2058762 RepID=UPI003B5B1906
MAKVILVLFTILIGGNCFAQKNIIKKADEEFDSYAYIDARKIYLKVVADGYESAQVFKKLGDTYYFNSEYKEAAKWYQKLITNYPQESEPDYYYRAAQSLKSIGSYKDSDRLMSLYKQAKANSSITKNNGNSSIVMDSLLNFNSEKHVVHKVSNNMTGSDFGPSFFGNKLVFASSSMVTNGDKIHNWTGQPYLDLYEAEIDEQGQLSNPMPLKGEINTPYHESSAAFTKDGNTIYFTRNNYINGKKKRGKDKLVSLKIYKATKDTYGAWNNVVELPFNSDTYSTAHPALSKDENRLYFSSNMPGTIGMSDIWYVDILENGYGKPINLGTKVNTEARETFPYISKSNNLYFSSDGHLGLGGLDIFMTSLDKNGGIGMIINLKQPINTNQDDFGFIIHESKKMGYLSSNRDGTEGSLSDDIYLVRESCNIVINGLITDRETGDVLSGAQVLLLDEENKIVSQATIDSDGTYSFEGIATCDNSYTIRGTYDQKEYQPNEKITTTPYGNVSLTVDLSLVPPDCPVDDLGCRVGLEPIYFDFDKSNIRPDAALELAKIEMAMKEYPQMKIHIETHTDSRGNDAYNEALSDRRAKSTMEWLVNQGIDRGRLSAKGYGETQLLNKCSNGEECSEDEHQLNRRSMFIIKD